MKRTKILSAFILLSLLLGTLVTFCACSGVSGEGDYSEGGGGSYGYYSADGGGISSGIVYKMESKSESSKMADGGDMAAEDASSERDGEGSTDSGEEGGEDPKEDPDDDPEEESEDPEKLTEEEIEDLIRAGLITAGAWNDNQYYSMWQDLFKKGQTEAEDGKFVSYTEDDWHMFSRERVKVSVLQEGNPVAGAKVILKNAESTPVFHAVTDAKGNAYLFSDTESGSVSVTSDGTEIIDANFSAEERDLTVSLTSVAEKKNTIQLMFVVDVTGSMGDEINYLKAELGDVIQRVAENDTETKISLSFLFYRDDDDDVKFCYVDFRDVTDPDDYAVQQAELAKQYASGGGDYPEALDEALEIAVSKQWSDNATKLIFLVLDAPAHEEEKNKTTYSNAVLSAAEQGIRICPVLASGADALTEYITRSAAILTGGTFVFITDDSGIGGEHLDPDLPNVVIERLNLLLVRLIKGYHTGDFGVPVWWNVKQ